MRRSDLVQNKQGNSDRTTQIIFGERQHLLRVLDSLEGSALPPSRRSHERRVLEELIHARTKELNEINASWDEKIGMVLSAGAKPDLLETLAKQAPKTDFYLLRLISEHPKVSSKTFSRWRGTRTAPTAKTWPGIPMPTLRPSPGSRATAASRCGTWWPSTRTRLVRCAASCNSGCVSSGKPPE